MPISLINRRYLLMSGLTAPLALAACGKSMAGQLGPAPQVEVLEGDYAAARAQFRTKLVRNGLAPGQIAMPHLTAGAERVEFTSGDLNLAGWIGRPAGATELLPAVLFLHGGFEFGAADFDMARPFIEAGFIVMVPILRGENGQGGSYSLFYNEVDDVLAAAEHLRGRPDVDPARLFVAGHSVGGTLTMLAAQASNRFRGAASFSGSPDQVIFIHNGMRGDEVPFDATDRREFQMRSPLSWAASFKAPARLYHGSEEAFFAQSTTRTVEVARAKGLDVVGSTIPGDHFSAVPAAMADAIAFFRKLAAA